MKHLINLIFNIFILISVNFMCFFLTIWYGRLPKVSIYHIWKLQFLSSYEIFNDEKVQSDEIKSDKTKVEGAEEFLVFLYKEEEFKNNVIDIKVPIFDGKEVIGSKNIYILL